MAETTARAPSMGIPRLQTSIFVALRRMLDGVETWLDQERDQLPLWLPVALGSGIAAWFWLPSPTLWIAFMTSMLGVALAGLMAGLGRRLGVVLVAGGLAAVLGTGLVWHRADSVSGPVLARPAMAQFVARVIRIEQRGSEAGIRLLLSPADGAALPARVRVSAKADDLPPDLVIGERVRLKARLMPPAAAMVPGAYDFARNAWFQRIGGTGKAIGKVERVDPAHMRDPSLRDRLSRHVGRQLQGSVGGVATALVTGDSGAIAASDEEAMRDSGLAHLLSISGLHISAVVAAAMLMTLRILALSQTLALRWPLIPIAAAAGALAGIGYTLLSGSEVPTVRSCIAAILVMVGLALGREAITLRLVATGALVVLLLWPESLVGPSFQLSFAAITAIVALHEHTGFRKLVERREEGPGRRSARALLSLLLTGIAVEIVLSPIALFHFHKAGLYGALANIVAIPLTTFVIMPLEALALVFDLVGLGQPFWWLAGQALALLLWVARSVAAAPGAVAMLPSVPVVAFAAILGGSLWMLLWRTPQRWIGAIPVFFGMLSAVMTSPPDVLVTGDGRHLAVRGPDGRFAILRTRAGEYVRDMLAETSGYNDQLDAMDVMRGARCNDDICTVVIKRGGRSWRIVATRSRHILPWAPFTALCKEADIVVSDRTLPKGCVPRWLKADRPFLATTGGISVYLGTGKVMSVKKEGDQHPWVLAARLSETGVQRDQYRRKSPASLP